MAKRSNARIQAERAACRDGAEQMQRAVAALLIDREHNAFYDGRTEARNELLALIEIVDGLDIGETPTYEEC
jgi:hypothetical protein